MLDWVNLWDWVQAVTPEQLPPAPFELHPKCQVVNSDLWLAKLKEDALHKRGPRAKTGAVHADMRRLYELVEGRK